MTGIPELVKLSGEVAAYVELSSLRAELQLQMAVGLARAWSEKKIYHPTRNSWPKSALPWAYVAHKFVQI